MFDPKTFHVVETLHDGRTVEIRAQEPSDRKAILEEVDHASAETLYHRFFAVKRSFTPEELHYFFDSVDFVKHVVLLAVAKASGGPRVVGGVRLVLLVEPGKAEVAFSVADDYQHHGLGAVLMHHIKEIGSEFGVKELVAEVLADNVPMIAVFDQSGLITTKWREGSTVHVTMRYPDS